MSNGSWRKGVEPFNKGKKMAPRVEKKVTAIELVDNMIEWLNVEVVKSKTNAKNKKCENALSVSEFSDLTKTLSTMIKVLNDAKSGLTASDPNEPTEHELSKMSIEQLEAMKESAH